MTPCPGRRILWGPRAWKKTFFLVFTYIWQESAAKIVIVSVAPRNVNLALVLRRSYMQGKTILETGTSLNQGIQ